MPQARKTLITIATYNELENLPRLVSDLFSVVPDSQILVIDDNSPDGTGDWCETTAAQDNRLRCLHRPEKQGLGTAILAGMRVAIDEGFDYMLNLDADFSHDPSYVPALLAAMENIEGGRPVDLAIGSRYVPGGSMPDWPWQRRMISRALNLYTRLWLGLKARDCSGGFRCYRTDTLRQLDLDRITSQGYSFQEEILWHLQRVGARFHEIPIAFRDRVRGDSKITLNEALQALQLITRWGLNRQR